MNSLNFRNWLRSVGTLRATLLASALLLRLPYLAFNPPSFLKKGPLILPSLVLISLDIVQVICSSIIIVECIRVLTFRRTQSLTLKKHFAFVLVLIVLLGTLRLVILPKTATRYYNYAWSLSESQHYGEALHSLDIALTYNRRNTKAFLERAYVRRRLGNYTAALADCSKAIEITPNDSDAYASRGQTYYYLGEYSRALTDFDKAISIDHKKRDYLEKWIEAARKNL